MSADASKPIGILGGTFDPIHHGHLRMALEAFYQLDLDHVRLIPLNQPVHRDPPFADAEQRCKMIQRAIAGLDMLTLDTRELDRNQQSYTIDTLQSLRQDYRDNPLCLLMGHDSFSTLDTWKDWQKLLDYTHIIVASRHQSSSRAFNSEITTLLNACETDSAIALQQQTHGLILQMQIPLLDISSSDIRERIDQQETIRYLLPDSVIEFIQSEKLYG